ncbi:unnamed protein product [Tilletia laevis]|uniref:MIR domain-containing protein n=2 Tax=Tilletia TaxID=13289 RepID=A0A177UDZ7_9BASI|nr:hypothetical protein CF335_g5513 [Tilletia laevis]KAE8265049.1 hypothetical protein A4X03_0g523 [Tilletia caries]CAD6900232.1 unnamed protein product [Tilletia controversa]KAE8200195.1 hypothetical protein CF336_g816 [Tilletia laevis]CAD6901940.1 unnamed protein product [Tilletia caries]
MSRRGPALLRTKSHFHSHPSPAPVTKENYEVSAYGDLSIGDLNDYWVVEVVDDLSLGRAKPSQAVRSLRSRIRFRHKNQGCYLFASTALLPQRGWKQVEADLGGGFDRVPELVEKTAEIRTAIRGKAEKRRALDLENSADFRVIHGAAAEALHQKVNVQPRSNFRFEQPKIGGVE